MGEWFPAAVKEHGVDIPKDTFDAGDCLHTAHGKASPTNKFEKL